MDLSLINGFLYSYGSYIIGITGVLLAVFFYFKNKKEKKPTYTAKSLNLIRNLTSKYKPLEMTYSGQKIDNLTVTKFAFWNSGKQTISKDDIAHREPLEIEMNLPYEILDFEVLYRKDYANDFSFGLSKNKRNLSINFDYVA